MQNGLTDEDSSRYHCERCEDSVNEDATRSVGNESWCSHCADNYAFRCENSGETYPDTCNSAEVICRNGYRETWHMDSVHDDAFFCDNSEEYYSNRYYTAIDVITSGGVENWCAEETHNFECENTGKVYSSDDYSEIEVNINDNERVTWCKEECEGEFFECMECGEFFVEDMRAESGNLFAINICKDCVKDGAEYPPAHPAIVQGSISDYRRFSLLF